MESLVFYFKVLKFDLLEYLKVVFRFYRSMAFALTDLSLTLKGWVDNPFRAARLYVERGGGDPDLLSSYTYGETPLTTFFSLAKEAGIKKGTKLIECGAGRGRVAIFAHYILGCQVGVYELVPEFVKRLKRLSFLNVQDKSFLDGDFSSADAIYLYGTTLSEEEIAQFGRQLDAAKTGTVLITVSWFLNEVAGTPSFPVLKVIEGQFPWGTTNLYIQVKSP